MIEHIVQMQNTGHPEVSRVQSIEMSRFPQLFDGLSLNSPVTGPASQAALGLRPRPISLASFERRSA